MEFCQLYKFRLESLGGPKFLVESRVSGIGILVLGVGILPLKITAMMFIVGAPPFKVRALGFKVIRLPSIVRVLKSVIGPKEYVSRELRYS